MSGIILRSMPEREDGTRVPSAGNRLPIDPQTIRAGIAERRPTPTTAGWEPGRVGQVGESETVANVSLRAPAGARSGTHLTTSRANFSLVRAVMEAARRR